MTSFSLQPGLNFILADDNNVGKSTIFKILTFAARMPNVSNEDALEILRVQEDRGYASFKFDDDHVILWLFRESANKVRFFFEQKDILGNSTRSLACPQKLLDALDIVRGDDGIPINFNDADSVQLVVQDTAKNDEVLSRVLVDLRVEDVRKNLQQLSKQIVQDYRYIKSKHDDTTHTLSSLHYNDAVDNFKDEEDTLNCAVRIMDTLDAGCNFTCDEAEVIVPEAEIEALTIASGILDKLEGINIVQLEQGRRIDIKGIPSIERAMQLYDLLDSIDCPVLSKLDSIPPQALSNAALAVKVLNNLVAASISLDKVYTLSKQDEQLSRELTSLKQELDSTYYKIQCPVKGDVYFSDEGCIPCND